MNSEKAKAYFEMRLKDKYKYAKGYTTQREAFEMAIKALEKQIKYKWHDLRRYPDDLPEKGKLVLTEIYGSDCIVCQEGETVEDAMNRIFSKHYTTAGWLDDDGWNGLDGYPMMVHPSLWREVEPYDD